VSRRYAADTTVAVERTQAEVSALLGKHGATARAVGVDDATGRAFVMFSLGGRQIRVDVLLHATDAAKDSPRGWWRWGEGQRRQWIAGQREQRERSAWRGLRLLLRAKLEAIEGGYSSVDREFLADLLLPGGKRVAEMVSDVVERAYPTGMAPLLAEATS
jgi:hypothetical protein